MKTSIDLPGRIRCTGANKLGKRNSQRGLVLLFTLIILIAMTLAGIALVRSVDTATIVAGNLAFRRTSVASSTKAVEMAAGWVGSTFATAPTQLENPISNVYFATRPGNNVRSDLTGNRTPTTGDDIDWPNAPSAGTDDAGNTAAYVIHRLCDLPGTLNPKTCSVVSTDSSAGKSYGSLIREEPYKGDMVGFNLQGYYLVTVRTSGPRDTVSFIQTVLLCCKN